MAIDERNPEAQLKHFINELVQNVTNDIEQKLLDQIKPMEKEEKLLTTKEVCYHFRISQSTLERRVRAGLKFSQATKKGNRLFKLTECKKFFNLN